MAAIVVAPLIAIFTVALAVSVGPPDDADSIREKLTREIPNDLMMFSLFETSDPQKSDETDCPEVELQVIIGDDGMVQADWYPTIQQFHGCAVDLPENGLPSPMSSQQFRVDDKTFRDLMAEMSALDWPTNAKFVNNLEDVVGYTNATCRTHTTALATDSVGAGMRDGTIVFEIHRSAPRALSYSTYSSSTVDPTRCSASAQRDEAIIDRMLAMLPIEYPANVIRR